MNGIRPSALLGVLALWIGGTLAAVSLFWHPDDTYLDMDEVYWIGSTYYFDLAFVRQDWAHPDWRRLPARENPPVAKYILGLGLAGAGQRVTTIDILGYFYQRWAREAPALMTGERTSVAAAATPGVLEEFRKHGRIPVTHPMIRAARLTVMGCTILASLLLMLLGLRAANWLAGLIASQLLLLHPIVVESYNHAMADAVALMFSLAAALALFGWFRRLDRSPASDRRSTLPRSVVTGLLLALACGAKMNSLVLVALMALLAAGLAGQAWRTGERTRAAWAVINGLIILVVGLALFVLINPAILQDPLRGLAATLLEHQHTGQIQAQFLDGYLTSWVGKLGAVARLIAFGWPALGALAAVVLWCAIRGWREPGIRFAVLWWCTALVCVTAWIPFAWSRYALPLLPPSLLLIGCAVSTILPRRFRARLSSPA